MIRLAKVRIDSIRAHHDHHLQVNDFVAEQ